MRLVVFAFLRVVLTYVTNVSLKCCTTWKDPPWEKKGTELKGPTKGMTHREYPKTMKNRTHPMAACEGKEEEAAMIILEKDYD